MLYGANILKHIKKQQIQTLGKRYLPLDNLLFNELPIILMEQKNKQKMKSIKNVHNVLFWDYKKDTYINPTEINSWLRRINEKYRICKEDNLTTHKLRHTAITHWRELGMPIEVIQYLAGHVEGSDITSNVYIDTSFNFVKNTLNKIS